MTCFLFIVFSDIYNSCPWGGGPQVPGRASVRSSESQWGGDSICFGVHCPPRTPWQQHWGFESQENPGWLLCFDPKRGPFLWGPCHFGVREIPSWPNRCSAYFMKWWHFSVISNVTMSHRDCPTTVFPFVHFSPTQTSRSVVRNEKFPPSSCDCTPVMSSDTSSYVTSCKMDEGGKRGHISVHRWQWSSSR